jgi:hypothetical protein
MITEGEQIMSVLTKAAIATAALLTVSTTGASAAIVCSGDVCWHTHEAYTYPPEAKVIVHEDNWRWGPSEKYTFREHEGRGYWSGSRWTVW